MFLKLDLQSPTSTEFHLMLYCTNICTTITCIDNEHAAANLRPTEVRFQNSWGENVTVPVHRLLSELCRHGVVLYLVVCIVPHYQLERESFHTSITAEFRYLNVPGRLAFHYRKTAMQSILFLCRYKDYTLTYSRVHTVTFEQNVCSCNKYVYWIHSWKLNSQIPSNIFFLHCTYSSLFNIMVMEKCILFILVFN